MIVYLDTSSLIKFFVWEANSPQTSAIAASAESSATSDITYVEIASALARKKRDGILTAKEWKGALRQFEEQWQNLIHLSIDDALLRSAAKLTEKYALRSLDAIHLASALTLRKMHPRQVQFLSADRRLINAAQKAGFLIP